jgi:hypothetical protein
MEYHYYYDATAKELRPCIEGTSLLRVQSLRGMTGNVFALDADGWVVGLFTDDGVFQALPSYASHQRHISQYGGEIPLQKKPVMLEAPKTHPALARCNVPVYKGKFENPLFFCTAEVIAAKLITGVYVYFGNLVSFPITSFLNDVKLAIQARRPFILAEEVFRDKRSEGRVFIKIDDIGKILATFANVKEE